VKRIVLIPKIILLLFLMAGLCVQTVFSDFIMCFGEDGHFNLDVSMEGNLSTSLHHLTEHHERSAWSGYAKSIFLSENCQEDCIDIVLALSAQFVNCKVKKVLSLNSAVNPLFSLSHSHLFDRVGTTEVRYTVHAPMFSGVPSCPANPLYLLI